ncbi:MAG TPA: hypothetical protein VK009_06935 [Chloroflexota bacterium]|nr:hypothetical protein [Chloroflexota bacterium]
MKRLGALLLGIFSCLLFAQPALADSPACQFVLGFQSLHDANRDEIGDCAENQAFAPNGDAQQHTSKGLLVWRKSDNWTAFTNGYWTWLMGPDGLVKRLNSDRFAWEHDPVVTTTTDSTTPAAPASSDYGTQVQALLQSLGSMNDQLAADPGSGQMLDQGWMQRMLATILQWRMLYQQIQLLPPPAEMADVHAALMAKLARYDAAIHHYELAAQRADRERLRLAIAEFHDQQQLLKAEEDHWRDVNRQYSPPPSGWHYDCAGSATQNVRSVRWGCGGAQPGSGSTGSISGSSSGSGSSSSGSTSTGSTGTSSAGTGSTGTGSTGTGSTNTGSSGTNGTTTSSH